MKTNLLIFFIISVSIIISCTVKQPETIDLSGEWQFQMDPEDVGENEKWFEKDFPETVKLPGSMVENGKGYDITLETKWTGGVRNPEWYNDPNYAPYHDSTNVRFPYWLQPVKKYTGAAWYRKKVTVPENWTGKPVLLTLERPHWESTVWVNSQKIEMQNSLATPHLFNISEYLKTGENSITVCIDNRTKSVDVGHDSHSISDHTQSNWNGIVGEIFLQNRGNIYFENIEIFPNVDNKTAEIQATVFSTEKLETTIKIQVFARLKNSGKNLNKKTFEFPVSPLLLKSKNSNDVQTEDFGLRDFKVDGTRFAINGRPVFLRGTLECAIFPLTGYPPTENSGWVKVFSAVKAHGLNHVRFHSWCPPEAAFSVADSMGIYLQVECSSWANSTTQLGSGLPIDKYIWDESKRIVKAYGNHPSFVMLAYGNEPGGPKFSEFLTEFVSHWKEKDNRRVYTGGAGWPALAVNDFNNLPAPRIQGWGEELRSIINSEPPKTDYDWSGKVPNDGIPVVSHEIGQWCVYPNFKEIEKYTGVLKSKNFEIFRESLIAHNMGNLADSFLLASGKLQTLCYKADIEAALRTPGFAGFQLLDLHDFP
ncbi:MAG: beta-galactosidase, partial [Bacteroidales bacterium]|nr:beta-galactosidase [Bacteroidales bacterium]